MTPSPVFNPIRSAFGARKINHRAPPAQHKGLHRGHKGACFVFFYYAYPSRGTMVFATQTLCIRLFTRSPLASEGYLLAGVCPELVEGASHVGQKPTCNPYSQEASEWSDINFKIAKFMAKPLCVPRRVGEAKEKDPQKPLCPLCKPLCCAGGALW